MQPKAIYAVALATSAAAMLLTATPLCAAETKEAKNETPVAATPRAPERTAGSKVDDASITAKVESALSTHRSTNSIKTKVETHDGEVLLTGIVANAAEKAQVTKRVSEIQGVTSVKNEMTVAEAKSK